MCVDGLEENTRENGGDSFMKCYLLMARMNTKDSELKSDLESWIL